MLAAIHIRHLNYYRFLRDEHIVIYRYVSVRLFKMTITYTTCEVSVFAYLALSV